MIVYHHDTSLMLDNDHFKTWAKTQAFDETSRWTILLANLRHHAKMV